MSLNFFFDVVKRNSVSENYILGFIGTYYFIIFILCIFFLYLLVFFKFLEHFSQFIFLVNVNCYTKCIFIIKTYNIL